MGVMEIASLHFLVAEGEAVQRELLVGMLRHLGAQHVTRHPTAWARCACWKSASIRRPTSP